MHQYSSGKLNGILCLALLSLAALLTGLAQESRAAVTNGKIVFESKRDPLADYGTLCLALYTVNPDGTEETNITDPSGPPPAEPCRDLPIDYMHPSFSPDGGQIAFAATIDGNNEIYVMNQDGSNIVRLTTDAGSNTYPAWSPDGSQLIFTTNRDGNNEIYVMNADGSGPQNLTNSPSPDSQAEWSPDGTTIAFTRGTGFNSEIYTMSSDGSNQVNITNSPRGDSNPAWSPDGSRIVFESGRSFPADFGSIFMMNPDGSNVTPLTDLNGTLDSSPTWSPDGTTIAFASGLGGGGLEIWTIPVSGGAPFRVTYREDPDSGLTMNSNGSSWQAVITEDPPIDPPDDPVDPPDEPIVPPDNPVDPPSNPTDPPVTTPSEPGNGPGSNPGTQSTLANCNLTLQGVSRKKKLSRRKVKRLLLGGMKAQVSCRVSAILAKKKVGSVPNFKMIILQRKGKRFFLPGTSVQVRRKNVASAARLSGTIRRLRKRQLGILRGAYSSKTSSTNLTYRTYNRRTKIGRKGVKGLKKARYRGSYVVAYVLQSPTAESKSGVISLKKP